MVLGRDGTPGRGFPRSAVRIFCVRGEEDFDGTPPFQERDEVTSEHLFVAKTMMTRETGPLMIHPARPSSRILCGAGAYPFETLTVQYPVRTVCTVDH